MKSLCLILAGALLAIAAPALADGDPVRGEQVFRKCAPCHSAERDVNKVGPSLYGVYGEPPASLRSFYGYSDAMKAFAATGNRWDEANLTEYLKGRARNLVPGTNMAFAGLRQPQDIADVIAFLRATNARQ